MARIPPYFSEEFLRTATFVGELLRNPRRTASLLPSSRELACLMVGEIDPNAGPVIEFGGGTGVFTRALLHHGVPAESVDVIEINPVFAKGLRRDFPKVRVLEIAAEIVSRDTPGLQENYQAAVSGLPLLAMHEEQQRAVLNAAFSLIAPGGKLYQFTYSPRRPVPKRLLTELGLACERIATSWRNLPPARVFCFSRDADKT